MNSKDCRHASQGVPAMQKGSTPQTQASHFFPVPVHSRYENAMIDTYIKDCSPLIIFACNGWQEHGKIISHDDKIILVVHEPVDGICLMYKHALSTIEIKHQHRPPIIKDDSFDFASVLPDVYTPSLISNNLEEECLSKFIQSRSHVTIVASNGYQEHGIILAHDENVIVFVRYKGDSPKLIYKRALSTIYMRY